MSRTLTVVASFEAKPGHGQALRTELLAMQAPSLAEDGCLGYQPYVDPQRPEHLVIVEEWTDRAALDSHFQTPHFRHVAMALEEILCAPFTLRHLTDVTNQPIRRV